MRSDAYEKDCLADLISCVQEAGRHEEGLQAFGRWGVVGDVCVIDVKAAILLDALIHRQALDYTFSALQLITS